MTIETVVERAAGLDIAKASLVACVRIPKPDGGWQVHKRKFATMSADLGALADWLAEHRVTRVGRESTSDSWRPVVYLLEDRFECWLLNARHMRAVPGRKTDRTDAEWICDLVAHGLVRPSFVPPPPIRRLRALTRRRPSCWATAAARSSGWRSCATTPARSSPWWPATSSARPAGRCARR
jgi:transposase